MQFVAIFLFILARYLREQYLEISTQENVLQRRMNFFLAIRKVWRSSIVKLLRKIRHLRRYAFVSTC